MQARIIDKGAVLQMVDGLKDFEKDRAIKSGLRAAAQVFRTGGRNRLRNRMRNPGGVTGNLLKSFTVKVKRNKPGALAGFTPIGAHVWLLDRGTKERRWKTRSHKSTGKVPGENSSFQLHFWGDTLTQDEGKAMRKLEQGIRRAVERINNRSR